MRDAYHLLSTPTTLQVQIKQMNEFDLSVFSLESADLFLDSIKQNRTQGFVEYAKGDWISLDFFLAHSQFSKLEAYCFLSSLFLSIGRALKNQPVILDVQAIFLSAKGDEIRLCRAPLIFEKWMKRQEDIEWFLNSLLIIFPSDTLEVLGLLWKGAQGKERFENLRSILARLYLEGTKKSFFTRHKNIPPYCAKKPICLPDPSSFLNQKDSLPPIQGTQFTKEWETRLPQSAQELFSQEASSRLSSHSLTDLNVSSSNQGEEESLSNLEILEKIALFDPEAGKDLENQKSFEDSNPNSKQFENSIPVEPKMILDSPNFSSESLPANQTFLKADSITLSHEVTSSKLDEKKEESKKASSKIRKSPYKKSSSDSFENATVVLNQWIEPCFLEIQGQKHTLSGQEIIVGREIGCHIQLTDPSISSIHAKLTCQEERWYIQDLKSTNFTWLNDKRVIRKMRLKEGMVIRFGQCEAIFHQSLPKA